MAQTQVWLADELEVSNNAVSKWIRTGKISRENAVAAAKVLNMSVEQLLGEEPRSGGERASESADELLRKATEILEIYRLADATGRERIDTVIGEIRSTLTALDHGKPGAQ